MSESHETKWRNQNVLHGFEDLHPPCPVQDVEWIQAHKGKDHYAHYCEGSRLFLFCEADVEPKFCDLSRQTEQPHKEHHDCDLVELVVHHLLVLINLENKWIVDIIGPEDLGTEPRCEHYVYKYEEKVVDGDAGR